jgi:DNA-binding CsgD family transcriptional regulator
MQHPTRVFVIGETVEVARRLEDIFTTSAGFAVLGLGASSTPNGFTLRGANVVVIKTSHPQRLLSETPVGKSLRPFRGPILWLSPDSHASRPNGLDAVLPTEATPAQITAAAAALDAGLHVGTSNHAPQTEEQDDFAILDSLTERELEVLNLVAEGLSNLEIAKRLGVSRNTVKFHVSSIIGKLGATSRTEAVTVGLRRGLIIV